MSVAAIILAAGTSRRWGADNKLLASIDGAPMIIRTVEAVLASKARPVILVTGHEAETVALHLKEHPISCVKAPDFGQGVSASLKTGIASVPADCGGALVCLGDMPWVKPSTLDRLVEAWERSDGKIALVPTYGGEWGNPVLLGRALFTEIAHLSGDRGARALIAANAALIGEIPIDDPGILRDLDQPGA